MTTTTIDTNRERRTADAQINIRDSNCGPRVKAAGAFVATLGISLGLLIPAGVARAQGGPGEMAAEWWEWALSIPTSVNPQLDPTGGNCMVGQRGSTWLLTGTFGGGTAVRNCSIPEGTALFFPVVNSLQINAPNVCGQGPGNISVKDLRQASAAGLSGATNLSVEVDGKPEHDIRRIQSVVFAAALPADNIFNAPCGGPGTVPPGIYSPAVDDGFYVTIEPLKIGNHTVHIHAQGGPLSIPLDVTYDLTVVAVLEQ